MSSVDANAVVSFLMPTSVVLLSLAVTFATLWIAEIGLRRNAEKGCDFLRAQYWACSRERSALVAGAPVQLVNVCRRCRILLGASDFERAP